MDVSRPWPGLFSFTEEQSEYFYGRDEEIEELFRRVKRDTITVLYGKSGVGKSSLLQAGLFPRLRRSAFLPVYIRLKFNEFAVSLESQVTSALKEAIDRSDLAEVAYPALNETLWEYLHHRGGNLVNGSGAVVCPVLVFDQFEEIFTLASSSDEARKLRDEFLITFADLAENSKPATLSARLAEAPKHGTLFDFSSVGCKFVVSLRQEYVANLDELHTIPSLSSASGRMRLKELNGEQALQVVSKPNPDLVSTEVAELIVRFVAGDAQSRQLVDLEIAPAILSLFCRELSIKRGNLPQITSDLVKGNAETIIDDFYKRYVDDKPLAVRCLIEDELVVSGYRNNIDLELAKTMMDAANVNPSVIDELVNNRVLHVEDFRGWARLELTHDVLLEPVRRRREQRLEQEAREAKELADRAEIQQAKEEARKAHELSKAKNLKRVVAGAIIAVLALSALFIYAWSQRSAAIESERRALRAQKDATDYAKTAEDNAKTAGEEKEKALVYLHDANAAKEEATKNAVLAMHEKKRAEDAEARAKKQAEQLKEVSQGFLDTCDTLATIFKDIGRERTGEDKALGATFAEMFEAVESLCQDNAEKLHKAVPENAEIAAWLGTTHVRMGKSKYDRDKKDEAREDAEKALVYADGFSTDPHYKIRIVAAQIYSLDGTLLVLLDDPRAADTVKKGTELADRTTSTVGPRRLDAWDWDTISLVYKLQGNNLEGSETYASSMQYYQKSYDAEHMAYSLDRQPSYLKSEMNLANDMSREANKLGDQGSEKKWHEKFLEIAYANAGDKDFYKDAEEALLDAKDIAALRTLIDRRIAALTENQTDVDSKRELADAYDDSSALYAELNNWPLAIEAGSESVKYWLAAREKASDPDESKKITAELVKEYGRLSWRELRAGRYDYALADSRRGLKENPSSTRMAIYEAHALLLNGQLDDAEKLGITDKNLSSCLARSSHDK